MWIAPQGDLWLATANGIFTHAGTHWHTLDTTPTDHIVGVDAMGRVWARGQTRLTVYDPAAHNWQHIPLPPWSHSQVVIELAPIAENEFWVEILHGGGASMDGGLVLYHYAAGQWHESINYDTWMHAIAITPAGTPWVLSENWLYRLSTTAALPISHAPT